MKKGLLKINELNSDILNESQRRALKKSANWQAQDNKIHGF